MSKPASKSFLAALAKSSEAKPRPVGRPPRTKKAADARFELRLTVKERSRWQAAADKHGQTLAEFVRACVEARC